MHSTDGFGSPQARHNDLMRPRKRRLASAAKAASAALGRESLMNYTLHLRGLLAAGVSAAALIGAAPALAAPAPAAATGADTTVGEIIVTAERREASIQSVPIAVTAFTAKERAIEGISTVQDMTNFTPGLT